MSQWSHIGGVVEQILRELGLFDRITEAKIFADWEGIVGKYFARMCQPVRFEPEDGELWIKALAPEWRQEFFSVRESLIGRINEKLGAKIVKKIRIV